jgi:hypothetical protein
VGTSVDNNQVYTIQLEYIKARDSPLKNREINPADRKFFDQIKPNIAYMDSYQNAGITRNPETQSSKSLDERAIIYVKHDNI